MGDEDRGGGVGMKIGDRFTYHGCTYEIVEICPELNGCEVRCDEVSRKVKDAWSYFPMAFVQKLIDN
jgi:hypothetical protein